MIRFRQYIPVIISVIFAMVIVLIFSVTGRDNDKVKEVYNVYLDGKLLGSVSSKKALENYIDREQKELKEEYGVDKIYVPNGIDIEKQVTSNAKISSEKQIYKKIQDKKKFTIKGYVVTISGENGKELKINTIQKKLFDKAAKKVVNVFVEAKDVEKYRKDTQGKIETTGSIIENIYIDQNITIKEAFISTDELIFNDVTTLTKYLLFGSLDKDEEYTVKPGDTIETVAFNNKLNTEEFLIVNPEFTSSKNLLSVGQKVSVALIDPILKVVVEKHIVEDMDKPYETVEKEDSNLSSGTEKVEVEGVNGIQRVTEKIKYTNGEISNSVIVKSDVIKEPVNKVVVKGNKKSFSYGGQYRGGGNYVELGKKLGWPTIFPYIITSGYKWRWGRMHNGIDIQCSYGSPVYSVDNGVVTKVNTGCPGHGSLGSNCGGGYGNVIYVDYGNGLTARFGHLAAVYVSAGQRISRGQTIGAMGNSGRSSGTHLHYELRMNGNSFDPRSIY